MTPVYHIQLIQPLSIGSATFLRETRLSNDNGKQDLPDHGLGEIARHFVGARQQGRSLPDFPGTIPADLVTAYQVQDQAIALWGDQVVGWKVGYIAAERRDASGDDRCWARFSRAICKMLPVEQWTFRCSSAASARSRPST